VTYVKSGRTRTLIGAAGLNAKSLGRLKAGRYRATLTPTLAGVKGKPSTVFFKVKPKTKTKR
jgi:hypothetical protein